MIGVRRNGLGVKEEEGFVYGVTEEEGKVFRITGKKGKVLWGNRVNGWSMESEEERLVYGVTGERRARLWGHRRKIIYEVTEGRRIG